MKKRDRVESSELLEAGLELMRLNGKPLVRLESPGRSMIYAMKDGSTVRVRTCNDHVLIVVADKPAEDARLNIEGTDWLLIVMPVVERQRGDTIAYLVPASLAAEEARRTHKEWLASSPGTKGTNTTWNLWFRSDAPGKANNYAERWQQYRLTGELPIEMRPANSLGHPTPGGIKGEVESARQRIAAVAGVPVEAVKITIDFGA